MDTIKDSIQELSQHFNTRLAEFQQNLSSTIPATSPTLHIVAQFSAFRPFVMSALEGLQLQVQVLAKQQDNLEMRSRRKIWLIHGVLEDKKENVSTIALSILSKHLQLPDHCPEDIIRCHRLGHVNIVPRVLAVKFIDLSPRNRIWFSKSNLKNTGMTLSEFLTRPRHNAFVAARQRLGIAKYWTNNGYIIIVDDADKRHSIITVEELSNIFNASESRDTAEFKPRQAPMTHT